MYSTANGGKVTKLLEEIKEKNTIELMERFKHLVGSQAVRSYLMLKKNTLLNIEVRLVEEELTRRMKFYSPSRATTVKS